MGFDARFTLTLLAWIGAVFAAVAGLEYALAADGLAATRLMAALILAATVTGLWWHVVRTNRTVARFVETLRHGDFATRFDHRGGAGFDALGVALNATLARLQAERARSAEELRFLEALVDDLPVALLTVDAQRGIHLANKSARALFGACEGTRAQDFAMFGETFAARLAAPGAHAEVLILRLPSGPQRAIFRAATLMRLGTQVRAITVEPVQGTLDAVEIAAQTDLVRVLTHEILNSLTPVTSLSATARDLLDSDPAGARIALATVARRAASLHGFIASYRAVSAVPDLRRQRFEAAPFAEELARLIRADWPALDLTTHIAEGLILTADPDLLAQALINLLKNAAQATRDTPDPRVSFTLRSEAGGVGIEIADNGPGIPLTLRRDIFLPFFTTRSDGTGIGLNLVRQIVIAHGWSIDVDDAPGGGARFRIAGAMERA